jgi:hypothetical protein
VGDAEIQHQRQRVRHVRKVGSQFNIPTMPTPVVSYVLYFHCMCCAEKVGRLINRPVVSLFGTRVSGTGTKMVDHRIYLELPATTNR